MPSDTRPLIQEKKVIHEMPCLQSTLIGGTYSTAEMMLYAESIIDVVVDDVVSLPDLPPIPTTLYVYSPCDSMFNTTLQDIN